MSTNANGEGRGGDGGVDNAKGGDVRGGDGGGGDGDGEGRVAPVVALVTARVTALVGNEGGGARQ